MPTWKVKIVWDIYIGLSNSFWCILFYSRIKLAIKEAEIQKLQANLAANQLSQNLIACNNKQESGKLNSVEMEPVKLGSGQLGKYIKLNSLIQSCLW